MIRILPATDTDCPAVCDLLLALFSQEAEFTPDLPKHRNGVSAIIADPKIGHILVAHRSHQVVGMVTLLYTISTALGERVALLEDMVVKDIHRGQGIGTLLLTHAIQFATEQGCKRITLLTDTDNLDAHRFYVKSGFAGSPMMPLRRLL